MHIQAPPLPRSERQAATNELLRIARDRRQPAPDRRAALDEAVVLNMPVAASIAARHRGRGIPIDDLEQVASLALVKVAKRFDPAQGKDFLTYAVPSIRGEVKRHFRDKGWTVRPPRPVQEAQSRVITARDELEGELGRPPHADEIAAHLDIDVETVTEALAAQGCFHPVSLDQPVGEGSATTLGDQLAGDLSPEELVEARVMIEAAVRRLEPRDRVIVRMRWFEDRTQQEIADVIGVTQMQVSRLIARILDDLRSYLEGPPDAA